MLTRALDTLRERAENITDTRIMGIVLAFLAGALVVSLGSAAGLTVAQDGNWLHNTLAWLDGFAQNFGTEMIGAAITFVLLEVMLDKRREREAEDREKERLVLQMGSPDNGFSVEAARQLRSYGWLYDGTLRDAIFHHANLAGADLRRANLVGANMRKSNLRGAKLWDSKLSDTIMLHADLSRADLQEADLSRAALGMTNLRAGSLIETNLAGADLRDANLANAILGDDHMPTIFDTLTILPDSSAWSNDTDMARFTDPDHLDFWRSDNPDSPAYHGKDDDKKATAES